ncbi:MAG TPA: metallophosphoesterase [Candidatus Polarisedimenticolaceae bacterium]|nr:metallophosphoesterase [Candidatus Polarisedimenticolaceae bacterium]
MRWVVGDIHGCARELEDLLETIRFDAGRDELWSVGDLVNTGPDSLETLRIWRDAGGRAVVGNHDIYALLVRSRRAPRRSDRLEALLRAADAEPLLARVRSSPALAALTRAIEPRAVWLVHAGLHPRWNDIAALAARLEAQPHDDDWLSGEEVSFMTRVRCCDGFGERVRFTGRPEDAPAPYLPWDAFYAGEALVVHGHWAMRGFYRGPRTMGLDSACVYGGRLTAWCVDDDRIESVPCRVPRGYLV